MRFSFKTKISLALFLSVALSLFLYSIFAGLSLSKRLKEEYLARSRAQSALIGQSLFEIEKFAEIISRSSLEYLSAVYQRSGIPQDSELKKIAQRLHVKQFYVTNNKGVFIRSTDTPLEVLKQKTIFDFCQEYRQMVDGNTDFESTPILTGWPKNDPFKFMMMPTPDRKFILESGFHFESIQPLLREALNKDHSVKNIGLFTPSAAVLGFVDRENALPPTFKFDPSLASQVEEGADSFVIFTKVAASSTKCCECKAKDITSKQGDYFYILRTEISRTPLLTVINQEKARLARAGVVGMIVAALFSFLLSGLLSKRFTRIHQDIVRIMNLKPGSDRALNQVSLAGNDEFTDIARSVNTLVDTLEDQHAKLSDQNQLNAVAVVVKQVAHDIRSPLSALELFLKVIPELPEEKRIMLRTSINRIRDIANLLLKKGNSTTDTQTPRTYHLLTLVDELVTEKRMQYSERSSVQIELSFENESYGQFIKVNPHELKRIVSNLINNAVEAISTQGCVKVRVFGNEKHCSIEIEDNGKGIPADILPKLGAEGFSYGKEHFADSGSGLGIFNAKTKIEEAGGDFTIESEVGKGTLVRLRFPRDQDPFYFIGKITLGQNQTLVAVDDDSSIHQLWRQRLAPMNITLESFSSPEAIISASSNGVRFRDALFLIDYEFVGQAKNGIDIIAELGISSRAILVTSRFDDPLVLQRAGLMNLKIIPKTMAAIVPIVLAKK